MKTITIIGGGPSLDLADVEFVRGRCEAIVINTAYQIARWANYLYARDYAWWAARPANVFYPENGKAVAKDNPGAKSHAQLSFELFHGQRWTGSVKAAGEFGLRHINTRMAEGINPIPGVIHEGGPAGANSGFQATNLAITQFHATRVLLLGFDMRGGHWHGDHPDPLTNVAPAAMSPFARSFESMVPGLRDMGVEVVNCTPGSAITCFRNSTVQAELRKG